MRRHLLQLTGWAWILLVAGIYYASHPLTAAIPPIFPVFHLWSAAAPGLVGCLLILSGGYGWLTLLGCPPQALLTLVSSWGAGLILAGSLGTLLGFTLGFSSAGLLFLILFLAVPAAFSIFKAVPRLDLKEIRPLVNSRISWLFLALFLVNSWFNLTGLLAPATTHDDLVYHLTIPAQFLHSGRIVELPNLYPSYRPQNMHVVSAWVGMVGPGALNRETAVGNDSGSTGSDSAIRCLSWFSGFWTTLLLWLSFGFRFNPTAGVLAAGAFFFHPQISWLSRTSYTDLPLLHLTVAGLIVLFEARRGTHRRDWLALGLLAACAMATKTSGLALAAFLAIAYLTLLVFRTETAHKAVIQYFSAFFLTLAAFGTFWYLRNAWLIGNPLNPHLTSLFTPWLVAPSLLAAFRDVFLSDPVFSLSHEVLLDRFGMGHDLFNLLLLPWNVTIHGHFHDPMYSLAFFDGQIGIIPLAVFPFLIGWLLRGQSWNWHSFLAVATIISLLFWGVGSHQVRFLLPSLTLLSMLIGVWLTLNLHWKRLALCLVILSGLYSCVYSANRTARHTQFLQGQQTREACLKEQLPFFGAYQFLNTLKNRGSVISAFEERVHYLAPPFLWFPLVPDYLVSAFFMAQNPDQVVTYLSRLGVTHIYLPRKGMAALTNFFDRSEYKSLLNRFFLESVKQVYNDENGEVWELKKN